MSAQALLLQSQIHSDATIEIFFTGEEVANSIEVSRNGGLCNCLTTNNNGFKPWRNQSFA